MKLIETYIYYDRPLLFLGEHEGTQFLNVLADDADGAERWTCVKVLPEEVEAFRNGLGDARLLYTEPADRDALIITVGDDGTRIIETEASSLSLAHKPDWGCYLRKRGQHEAREEGAGRWNQ